MNQKTSFETDANFPRFSKSCKQFNKKNALAFYILIVDRDSMELKHREMLRIVNNGEDYYIFPYPLKKISFHLSYHKSGEFHWVYEDLVLRNKYHFPKEQERDFRTAFRDYLSIQSKFGWIVGYCVSYGPQVNKATLGKMLDLLTRYVVIDFSTEEALNDIFNRKHITQWNPRIVSNNTILVENISFAPFAIGIAIAELIDNPGVLHTLNLAISYDKKISKKTLLFRHITKEKGVVVISSEKIKNVYIAII
jgi:hypothetical protein